MNINSKNFDKIEAYLFNQMTAAEKNAFEVNVEQDANLAKELKLQKAEHQVMQLLLRDKLKSKIGKWQSEVTTAAAKEETSAAKVVKLEPNRRSRIFRLSIAASVLLVIGLFTNLWVDTNLSDAALADDFFNTTYTARSGTATASEVLAPGLTAMETKNYTKAVELFSQIKDGNYRETALILKGESYFQLAEYKNAIEVFQEVIQNKVTPLNVEKAEWKLLLAHLRMGNTSEVENLKTTILNNRDHAYYPRVVELDNQQDHFFRKLFYNFL